MSDFITGSTDFADDLAGIADWFDPFVKIADAISNLIGLIN